MKNLCIIQVFDLRFQVDDVKIEKNQTYEEYRGDTANVHFDA